jgi:hypothetical protein
MAFSYTNSKGQTYYLHSKQVTLKGNLQMQIYYFKREVDSEFAIDALPEGREVVENKRTGLPLVRRIKKDE